MKTSTVLALGGLGALAWYLTRQRQGAGVPGGVATGFGAPVPTPDDKYVAGDIIGKNDWFLSTGARADVCDLPNDRHTAWSDEQKQCVSQYHAGRAQSFYDQVWKPASRIPIRSLTAADFQLATKFLANALDRRGVPWTYGQSAAVNDFNDLGAVAFVRGVDVLAKALGKDASGAADKAEAYYTDAILELPSLTQGGENQLTVREAVPPGDRDYDDPIFAQYGEANKAWDAVFIDPRGPSMDFGFDPIEFPWGNVYFRSQLFRAAQLGTGWEKPWVCRELGYPHEEGDGGGLTDKTMQPHIVAAQARLYRTLDVMGAMMKPDVQNLVYGAKPDAEGNINVADLQVEKRVRPGLYAYKVGVVELWGCVLPATAADKAQDLSQVTGKRLARDAYAGDIPPAAGEYGTTDYTPYVPPPPTRDAPTASGIPTVTKGAPQPTQTATSGYNVPASNAGAPTPSPTIAGGGRRLSSII